MLDTTIEITRTAPTLSNTQVHIPILQGLIESNYSCHHSIDLGPIKELDVHGVKIFIRADAINLKKLESYIKKQ